MSVKDPNKNRRLRYGGVATAITVGVIAVIVVLNVLVTALNTRFPLSVDMTSDKRFTLSEQGTEYLKKVESDITIYLMMPKEEFENVGDPGSRVPPALEQFSQVNPKIKVEYLSLIHILTQKTIKTDEAAQAAKDSSRLRTPVYQSDRATIENQFTAAVREVKKLETILRYSRR